MMKKILCLILVIFVCSCATVHISDEIAKIAIIEGTPNRKFVKIEPVWYLSEVSMKDATNGLKKQAAKVDADAIIEFTFGSGTSGAVGGIGGTMAGGMSSYPTCQGWAVKWVE